MILPSDIPLLTAEDIEEIVKLGRFRGTMVIAPDCHKDGTNALFIKPLLVLFNIVMVKEVLSVTLLMQNLQVSDMNIFMNLSGLPMTLDTPNDLKIYAELAEKYNIPMLDIDLTAINR